MPINQNHLFEELDGVKCSIVEKNVSPARVEFLKKLLEYNGFTVVVSTTPAPKAVPAKPAPKPVASASTTEGAETPVAAAIPADPSVGETSVPVAPPPPAAPETYTIGVTDLIFNPTNAIFGRLLRTPDGRVVTLAYWQQKDEVAHDEVPYYERKI